MIDPESQVGQARDYVVANFGSLFQKMFISAGVIAGVTMETQDTAFGNSITRTAIEATIIVGACKLVDGANAQVARSRQQR